MYKATYIICTRDLQMIDAGQVHMPLRFETIETQYSNDAKCARPSAADYFYVILDVHEGVLIYRFDYLNKNQLFGKSIDPNFFLVIGT